RVADGRERPDRRALPAVRRIDAVFVPGLIEHGLVAARAAEAIQAINTHWEAMRASPDRRIWADYVALDDAPEWQRTRDLGRAARAAPRAAGLPGPPAARGPWLDWAGLPVPQIPRMLDACGSVLVPRLASAGLI